jgi:hypothetical protein
MFLLDFIKSLAPTINKQNILEDIRITKSELSGIVIPTMKQAEEHFKIFKMKSPANSQLSLAFYKAYTLDNSKAKLNFISEISSKLPIVLNNISFIESEIDLSLTSDVVSDGITTKKALLLRAAEDISFISRFTMDLLTVVYASETNTTDADSGILLQVSDIVGARVRKNITIYAKLLSIFGNSSFILEKRYNNMLDVVMNDSTYNVVIATYNENVIDPINTIGLKGFESNPIYHLRLMYAEWQADRYKSMKDKKRMLELRVLQLKLQSDHKSDIKKEKEISYIQSRIEKIDYSMAKMES